MKNIQYWWVNHKQTFKEEIDRGYMWSPKKEADGRVSQFYNYMKEAAPGDFVVSYANTKSSYIGIVTDYAVNFPRPEGFDQKAKYWSDGGWMVKVKWYKTNGKFSAKNELEHIRDNLPKKYSPVSLKNGNGNQKAYFSKINEAIFGHVAKVSDFNINEQYTLTRSTFENDNESLNIKDTEYTSMRKTRVGQDQFRKSLFKNKGFCVITGVVNPSLLIASHIKPWQFCESASERLDPYNGLLLTPHIDCLFERGLISFNNNGEVLLSSHLSEDERTAFGLSNVKQVEPFDEGYHTYLEYHRENKYLGHKP